MRPIDVDASEAIEYLDKMQFFGGQRAGRELWADRPKEVQDADLAAFNRDIELLRKVVLSKVENTTIEAEPVRIDGNTSDGYHTFNELYHHRAVLFSVIVKAFPQKAWKSRKHHDGTMFDGMFIVGIETDDGQATYHYDLEPYWDMFNCTELEFAPEWDGHTANQAIERIGKLEPVRHGKWIAQDETYTRYFCSECKSGNHQGHEKFCPPLRRKDGFGGGKPKMTDREKLVELLDIIIQPGQKTLGEIADHLLAHGVTVKEPQKPLTLEEVLQAIKDCKTLWIEDEEEPTNTGIDPGCYNVRYWLNKTVIKDEIRACYGKTWRCWAEKPTEEERRAAEWES